MTFDPTLFGTELAAILNALLRVQDMDSEGFATAPTPFLGAFTRPSGNSWYEADALTLQYHRCGISLHVALIQDEEIGAIFAPTVENPYGLSMTDVRAMLHRRYLSHHRPPGQSPVAGEAVLLMI
jgi:hypothetical protein